MLLLVLFHNLMIPSLWFLTLPKANSLSASSLSFSYGRFSPNDKGLVYNGSATPSIDGIQLTTNQRDKAMSGSFGRVTYDQPLHLWDQASGHLADFNTRFSFVINSQGNLTYADGMTFFVAPLDFPLALGPEGRGLGLVSGNETAQSSNNHPFLAVEFDTFGNPEYNDPDYDHVGIDINSMISVEETRWWSKIRYGRTNTVWLSYNSTTKNLAVNFTGFPDGNKIYQVLNYAVDLRRLLPEYVVIGFSASTGSLFEIHTLKSWSFNSNLKIDGLQDPPSPAGSEPIMKHQGKESTSNIKMVVGVIVGLACAVLVGVFGYFSLRKKKRREGSLVRKDDDPAAYLSIEFEQSIGPKKFTYEILAQATNNFGEAEKLGQGGFGGVYRGFIKALNSDVAVKKISSGSKQGVKEYSSEVKIISRLRHKNLVQLIGWCHEKGDLLLVYELMANGSLDYHLFRSKVPLSWALRYNIAHGLASALLYLHEGWEQVVLHRDIKASNIMLDSGFNAKLGDFGLARLVDHGKGSDTTILAGTIGYIAPECLHTCKASTESDVFSFGIVCLEISCGRKSINPIAKDGEIRLVDWVWNLYGEGRILEAIDPGLIIQDYDEKQVECLMTLGLWCAHPDHKVRPSMRQVMPILNLESPLPKLPLKVPVPTYPSLPFFMDNSISAASSSSQSSSTTAATLASSSTFCVSTR